jgi:hypothetical protein
LSPFPRALALSLVLLARAAPGGAEAILEVSGTVVSTAPRLEVRVVVKNRGDRRAAPLEVVGEMLGERIEARLAGGVAPGREGAVLLEFSPENPRPGTHALTLLLEHPVEGTPTGPATCRWPASGRGSGRARRARLRPCILAADLSTST